MNVQKANKHFRIRFFLKKKNDKKANRRIQLNQLSSFLYKIYYSFEPNNWKGIELSLDKKLPAHRNKYVAQHQQGTIQMVDGHTIQSHQTGWETA